MRKVIGIMTISMLLLACSATDKKDSAAKSSLPIVGTWKLISGTTIQKGDTTTTYYDKNLSFIKIINDTHFAFLNHDIHKGKDSATAAYSSGGGSYTLHDSTYTEHLEYCSDRQWEGNDFPFTIRIKNDTLTQTGIEKVESEGVDRLNIEKYVRLK
jgi:major membrane immunogen (membrane-anchored lipoprotein)